VGWCKYESVLYFEYEGSQVSFHVYGWFAEDIGIEWIGFRQGILDDPFGKVPGRLGFDPHYR
jgi:hypothetical protein